MTQDEFLLDMLAYYTVNTFNRRCTTIGACYYSPKNANQPKSEGCAIGRHLPPELQKELDDIANKGDSTSVIKEKIFEKLPNNLKELGQEFLHRVQMLHDFKENWYNDPNNDGLTETGIIKLEFIIEKFNLQGDYSQYLGVMA